MTREAALAQFDDLRTSNSSRPTIVSVVSGLVTLQPGLGVDPVTARSAWLIVYTAVSGAASCPIHEGDPAPPPTASYLNAVIIFGNKTLPGQGSSVAGPALGYEGAGTGICTPSTQPKVLTEDQLRTGEY